jgi:hypothetical protein
VGAREYFGDAVRSWHRTEARVCALRDFFNTPRRLKLASEALARSARPAWSFLSTTKVSLFADKCQRRKVEGTGEGSRARTPRNAKKKAKPGPTIPAGLDTTDMMTDIGTKACTEVEYERHLLPMKGHAVWVIRKPRHTMSLT